MSTFGGIVQLATNTTQEDFILTDNPSTTLFKTNYRRHVNFAKVENELYFNNDLNFGKTTTLEIPKLADYINKLTLMIKLPEIYCKYKKWNNKQMKDYLLNYEISYTYTNNDDDYLTQSDFERITGIITIDPITGNYSRDTSGLISEHVDELLSKKDLLEKILIDLDNYKVTHDLQNISLFDFVQEIYIELFNIYDVNSDKNLACLLSYLCNYIKDEEQISTFNVNVENVYTFCNLFCNDLTKGLYIIATDTPYKFVETESTKYDGETSWYKNYKLNVTSTILSNDAKTFINPSIGTVVKLSDGFSNMPKNFLEKYCNMKKLCNGFMLFINNKLEEFNEIKEYMVLEQGYDPNTLINDRLYKVMNFDLTYTFKIYKNGLVDFILNTDTYYINTDNISIIDNIITLTDIEKYDGTNLVIVNDTLTLFFIFYDYGFKLNKSSLIYGNNVITIDKQYYYMECKNGNKNFVTSNIYNYNIFSNNWDVYVGSIYDNVIHTWIYNDAITSKIYNKNAWIDYTGYTDNSQIYLVQRNDIEINNLIYNNNIMLNDVIIIDEIIDKIEELPYNFSANKYYLLQQTNDTSFDIDVGDIFYFKNSITSENLYKLSSISITNKNIYFTDYTLSGSSNICKYFSSYNDIITSIIQPISLISQDCYNINYSLILNLDTNTIIISNNPVIYKYTYNINENLCTNDYYSQLYNSIYNDLDSNYLLYINYNYLTDAQEKTWNIVKKDKLDMIQIIGGVYNCEDYVNLTQQIITAKDKFYITTSNKLLYYFKESNELYTTEYVEFNLIKGQIFKYENKFKIVNNLLELEDLLINENDIYICGDLKYINDNLYYNITQKMYKYINGTLESYNGINNDQVLINTIFYSLYDAEYKYYIYNYNNEGSIGYACSYNSSINTFNEITNNYYAFYILNKFSLNNETVQYLDKTFKIWEKYISINGNYASFDGTTWRNAITLEVSNIFNNFFEYIVNDIGYQVEEQAAVQINQKIESIVDTNIDMEIKGFIDYSVLDNIDNKSVESFDSIITNTINDTIEKTVDNAVEISAKYKVDDIVDFNADGRFEDVVDNVVLSQVDVIVDDDVNLMTSYVNLTNTNNNTITNYVVENISDIVNDSSNLEHKQVTFVEDNIIYAYALNNINQYWNIYYKLIDNNLHTYEFGFITNKSDALNNFTNISYMFINKKIMLNSIYSEDTYAGVNKLYIFEYDLTDMSKLKNGTLREINYDFSKLYSTYIYSLNDEPEYTTSLSDSDFNKYSLSITNFEWIYNGNIVKPDVNKCYFNKTTKEIYHTYTNSDTGKKYYMHIDMPSYNKYYSNVENTIIYKYNKLYENIINGITDFDVDTSDKKIDDTFSNIKTYPYTLDNFNSSYYFENKMCVMYDNTTTTETNLCFIYYEIFDTNKYNIGYRTSDSTSFIDKSWMFDNMIIKIDSNTNVYRYSFNTKTLTILSDLIDGKYICYCYGFVVNNFNKLTPSSWYYNVASNKITTSYINFLSTTTPFNYYNRATGELLNYSTQDIYKVYSYEEWNNMTYNTTDEIENNITNNILIDTMVYIKPLSATYYYWDVFYSKSGSNYTLYYKTASSGSTGTIVNASMFNNKLIYANNISTTIYRFVYNNVNNTGILLAVNNIKNGNYAQLGFGPFITNNTNINIDHSHLYYSKSIYTISGSSWTYGDSLLNHTNQMYYIQSEKNTICCIQDSSTLGIINNINLCYYIYDLNISPYNVHNVYYKINDNIYEIGYITDINNPLTTFVNQSYKFNDKIIKVCDSASVYKFIYNQQLNNGTMEYLQNLTSNEVKLNGIYLPIYYDNNYNFTIHNNVYYISNVLNGEWNIALSNLTEGTNIYYDPESYLFYQFNPISLTYYNPTYKSYNGFTLSNTLKYNKILNSIDFNIYQYINNNYSSICALNNNDTIFNLNDSKLYTFNDSILTDTNYYSILNNGCNSLIYFKGNYDNIFYDIKIKDFIIYVIEITNITEPLVDKDDNYFYYNTDTNKLYKCVSGILIEEITINQFNSLYISVEFESGPIFIKTNYVKRILNDGINNYIINENINMHDIYLNTYLNILCIFYYNWYEQTLLTNATNYTNIKVYNNYDNMIYIYNNGWNFNSNIILEYLNNKICTFNNINLKWETSIISKEYKLYDYESCSVNQYYSFVLYIKYGKSILSNNLIYYENNVIYTPDYFTEINLLSRNPINIYNNISNNWIKNNLHKIYYFLYFFIGEACVIHDLTDNPLISDGYVYLLNNSNSIILNGNKYDLTENDPIYFVKFYMGETEYVYNIYKFENNTWTIIATSNDNGIDNGVFVLSKYNETDTKFTLTNIITGGNDSVSPLIGYNLFNQSTNKMYMFGLSSRTEEISYSEIEDYMYHNDDYFNVLVKNVYTGDIVILFFFIFIELFIITEQGFKDFIPYIINNTDNGNIYKISIIQFYSNITLTDNYKVLDLFNKKQLIYDLATKTWNNDITYDNLIVKYNGTLLFITEDITVDDGVIENKYIMNQNVPSIVYKVIGINVTIYNIIVNPFTLTEKYTGDYNVNVLHEFNNITYNPSTSTVNKTNVVLIINKNIDDTPTVNYTYCVYDKTRVIDDTPVPWLAVDLVNNEIILLDNKCYTYQEVPPALINEIIFPIPYMALIDNIMYYYDGSWSLYDNISLNILDLQTQYIYKLIDNIWTKQEKYIYDGYFIDDYALLIYSNIFFSSIEIGKVYYKSSDLINFQIYVKNSDVAGFEITQYVNNIKCVLYMNDSKYYLYNSSYTDGIYSQLTPDIISVEGFKYIHMDTIIHLNTSTIEFKLSNIISLLEIDNSSAFITFTTNNNYINKNRLLYHNYNFNDTSYNVTNINLFNYQIFKIDLLYYEYLNGIFTLIPLHDDKMYIYHSVYCKPDNIYKHNGITWDITNIPTGKIISFYDFLFNNINNSVVVTSSIVNLNKYLDIINNNLNACYIINDINHINISQCIENDYYLNLNTKLTYRYLSGIWKNLIVTNGDYIILNDGMYTYLSLANIWTEKELNVNDKYIILSKDRKSIYYYYYIYTDYGWNKVLLNNDDKILNNANKLIYIFIKVDALSYIYSFVEYTLPINIINLSNNKIYNYDINENVNIITPENNDIYIKKNNYLDNNSYAYKYIISSILDDVDTVSVTDDWLIIASDSYYTKPIQTVTFRINNYKLYINEISSTSSEFKYHNPDLTNFKMEFYTDENIPKLNDYTLNFISGSITFTLKTIITVPPYSINTTFTNYEENGNTFINNIDSGMSYFKFNFFATPWYSCITVYDIILPSEDNLTTYEITIDNLIYDIIYSSGNWNITLIDQVGINDYLFLKLENPISILEPNTYSITNSSIDSQNVVLYHYNINDIVKTWVTYIGNDILSFQYNFKYIKYGFKNNDSQDIYCIFTSIGNNLEHKIKKIPVLNETSLYYLLYSVYGNNKNYLLYYWNGHEWSDNRGFYETTQIIDYYWKSPLLYRSDLDTNISDNYLSENALFFNNTDKYLYSIVCDNDEQRLNVSIVKVPLYNNIIFVYKDILTHVYKYNSILSSWNEIIPDNLKYVYYSTSILEDGLNYYNLPKLTLFTYDEINGTDIIINKRIFNISLSNVENVNIENDTFILGRIKNIFIKLNDIDKYFTTSKVYIKNIDGEWIESNIEDGYYIDIDYYKIIICNNGVIASSDFIFSETEIDIHKKYIDYLSNSIYDFVQTSIGVINSSILSLNDEDIYISNNIDTSIPDYLINNQLINTFNKVNNVFVVTKTNAIPNNSYLNDYDKLIYTYNGITGKFDSSLSNNELFISYLLNNNIYTFDGVDINEYISIENDGIYMNGNYYTFINGKWTNNILIYNLERFIKVIEKYIFNIIAKDSNMILILGLKYFLIKNINYYIENNKTFKEYFTDLINEYISPSIIDEKCYAYIIFSNYDKINNIVTNIEDIKNIQSNLYIELLDKIQKELITNTHVLNILNYIAYNNENTDYYRFIYYEKSQNGVLIKGYEDNVLIRNDNFNNKLKNSNVVTYRYAININNGTYYYTTNEETDYYTTILNYSQDMIDNLYSSFYNAENQELFYTIFNSIMFYSTADPVYNSIMDLIKFDDGITSYYNLTSIINILNDNVKPILELDLKTIVNNYNAINVSQLSLEQITTLETLINDISDTFNTTSIKIINFENLGLDNGSRCIYLRYCDKYIVRQLINLEIPQLLNKNPIEYLVLSFTYNIINYIEQSTLFKSFSDIELLVNKFKYIEEAYLDYGFNYCPNPMINDNLTNISKNRIPELYYYGGIINDVIYSDHRLVDILTSLTSYAINKMIYHYNDFYAKSYEKSIYENLQNPLKECRDYIIDGYDENINLINFYYNSKINYINTYSYVSTILTEVYNNYESYNLYNNVLNIISIVKSDILKTYNTPISLYVYFNTLIYENIFESTNSDLRIIDIEIFKSMLINPSYIDLDKGTLSPFIESNVLTYSYRKIWTDIIAIINTNLLRMLNISYNKKYIGVFDLLINEYNNRLTTLYINPYTTPEKISWYNTYIKNRILAIEQNYSQNISKTIIGYEKYYLDLININPFGVIYKNLYSWYEQVFNTGLGEELKIYNLDIEKEKMKKVYGSYYENPTYTQQITPLNLYVVFKNVIETNYNNFASESDLVKFLVYYLLNTSEFRYSFELIDLTANNSWTNIYNYYYNQLNQVQTQLNKINVYNDYFTLTNYSVLEEYIRELSKKQDIEYLECSWINEIGHYIIDKIDFLINDYIIDSINGEYLHILYQTELNRNQIRGYNNIIGNIYKLTNYDKTVKPEHMLYIPCPFTFCKNIANSIPLICLQHSTITLRVTLTELNKLIKYNSEGYIPQMNKIDENDKFNKIKKLDGMVIANYIYMDFSQRLELVKHKQEMLIDKVKYYDDLILDLNKNFEQTVKIEFQGLSKELFVIIQPINYINGSLENNEYKFNDYTLVDKNQNIRNPINTIKIKYNGIERQKKCDIEFYNLIQRYQHNTYCDYDGIDAYSFSIFPEDIQPSGVANLGKIGIVELDILFNKDLFTYKYDKTTKTIIKRSKTEKIVRVAVYSKQYNFLRIMSGLGGLMYSE